MAKRRFLSIILCLCLLFSVLSVGLVGSSFAETVNTYSDKVSLTFDGDAPYGIPVHRGVNVFAYENGYAKLQNNAKVGGAAFIGKNGTVGASPAYYKNDTAEVLAEAKSNLFMCEAGKTYRLKFDFKFLAGTSGLTKKVDIWLHPDPTATSISDYDLSDRATLVESQAATMTIAETETVLTEDTEWATAYYIFTVNADQTDGVAIGFRPGYSSTYVSILAIDNLTVSEVGSLEYNESLLHTMDDATNDAYIVGSGCNDGTALVDNYDEEHGSVLKLVGGDYARLGFEDLDIKQNRKYCVYFDAKAETDNAQPVMVLGVNGSGTKSCRFFFMGYQTPSDRGASFFVNGKQVKAASVKFSTEWQRYGIVIDTSNEELLAKITAYKADFWNKAIHFLFGVSGDTAYFDNVQVIEVESIPESVPAENDASAAASVRAEKKAADNNGVYRSAGLRFRGTIDNSVKETADEIGFLVAPSSSVMVDTDWYKFESGLNPIVKQGVCYEKNGKDIVYQQGANQTAYQMILTGLSTEDGKTAYIRRFTAVMYVKSGEAYTYYALGETSYNQVVATYNVMNIKIDTLYHYYESSITKYPRALDEGEITFTCKRCKHTYTETLPKTKTLKVLALGNSFSVDAMQYLWDIANDAGVENIVLGNINISGCSIDMHWDNINNDTIVNYKKNTTGTWKGTRITVAEILADEEWDIISLQQNSANSAFPDTYGNFNNLVNYISDCKPNARIVWHLTWSYQHTSTKEVFEEFDRDPIKMYNAIVSTYKEKVEPCELITSVTPSGTAVQNLRSSYIGDTITRDGFHMSYSHGRYLVGLTWFAALTGGDVDDVTWIPSDYPELADDLLVIRQSVKDAIKQPFAVTQQATCPHSYESSITKYPRALDEGEKTFTCKLCEHTYTEILPKTNTLKVLALGNSFSVDAMEYLWDIANNAGVENIVLGNLYIASCNLDMHWENISNSNASYTYYKNTSGKWNSTKGTSVQTALADEEWDIISVQQSSGNSAKPSSFTNFDNVINYLSENEPNARVVWHMTWSYQHDNTKHAIFKEFDRDPVKMYNAIVSTYKEKVEPCELITSVIPSGTAVQNLRSSYIGDTITRDTYHLSYSHGRYLVALTWFAALTGGDVDSITWLPSDYPELADDLPVIRQSVKDAIKTPFAITQQQK